MVGPSAAPAAPVVEYFPTAWITAASTRIFARLVDWLPVGVRVIRLATNRFFGEGNNIGAEAARGRLLVVLNNDAFVGRATMSTLADVFERFPDAGAVGPKFVDPDWRIQEAGASISSCGTVTQRGKHLDDLPTRSRSRISPITSGPLA